MRNPIPTETAITGRAAQDDDDFRLSLFNSIVWWTVSSSAVFGGLALISFGLVASWHFTGRIQHEYLLFAGVSFISLFWCAVFCRASMNTLEEFYAKSTGRADEAERQNFALRSQTIEALRARRPNGQEGKRTGSGGFKSSPSASILRIYPDKDTVQ